MVTGFGPIMPTFQGQVSEEQLMQILAFIKSLQIETSRNRAGRAASPVDCDIACASIRSKSRGSDQIVTNGFIRTIEEFIPPLPSQD